MDVQDPKPLSGLIGRDNFASEILGCKGPVLVAFESPWSQPCQVLSSTLEEVAAAWAGSVQIVKINADNNPDLSLWYDIQFVPTLLYFVNGVLGGRTVGTASRDAILTKMQAAIHLTHPDTGHPPVAR